MRKRFAGSGWLLLCVMLLWWSMPCGSFAEETDGGQTEEALEDYTEELLKELDFEEIDEFLKELDVGGNACGFLYRCKNLYQRGYPGRAKASCGNADR